MSSLVANHPLIYKQFIEGHFVAHKSRRVFSGLATDQVHEQNNAKVKGEGGAVGLLDSPNALRRWMCGGPEAARVCEEYKCSYMKEENEKCLGIRADI